MLVIRGELDRVCGEPNEEEYVVRRFEGGVRLFGGLVNGKGNHDQNQVLYGCFRGKVSSGKMEAGRGEHYR